MSSTNETLRNLIARDGLSAVLAGVAQLIRENAEEVRELDSAPEDAVTADAMDAAASEVLAAAVKMARLDGIEV